MLNNQIIYVFLILINTKLIYHKCFSDTSRITKTIFMYYRVRFIYKRSSHSNLIFLEMKNKFLSDLAIHKALCY